MGAVDIAPRISDREIVEKLARLEEGQKSLRSEMNKRQAQMETSLETQKDEIAWLKEMITKLLPPKGVL
ncbi:MAG: hypothetical protein ACE5GM_10860 [bacterium]